MRIVKFTVRVITCVSLLIISSSALAQDEPRILEWFSKDNGTKTFVALGRNQTFNPSEIKALEIVSVTLDGQPIQIGKEFSTGDNWISRLVFKVKNISLKNIRSISLGLSLPETQNGESKLGTSFTYGKELSKVKSLGSSRSIQPDEEVELKFSELEYKIFQDFIAHRSPVKNFKKILIGNAMVYFEDGTFWLGGSLPVVDKSTQ